MPNDTTNMLINFGKTTSASSVADADPNANVSNKEFLEVILPTILGVSIIICIIICCRKCYRQYQDNAQIAQIDNTPNAHNPLIQKEQPGQQQYQTKQLNTPCNMYRDEGDEGQTMDETQNHNQSNVIISASAYNQA